MIVLSAGGGIQSSALILMAVKGLIQKPDLVIFADTGSEMPSTIKTIGILQDLCHDAGIKFEIVQHGILYEDYMEKGLLPRIGNSSCTMKYKINPIRRYLRANQDETGPKPWSEVWIGITTDESHRARESDVQWIENKFPLIDLGYSRKDCIHWLNENYQDLKIEKSGCFHCHFNKSQHWVDLRENHPDLFKLSIDMENAAKDGQYGFRNGLYRNKTIRIFDYTHKLTDFGVEIKPVDIDCQTVGGCFL